MYLLLNMQAHGTIVASARLHPLDRNHQRTFLDLPHGGVLSPRALLLIQQLTATSARLAKVSGMRTLSPTQVAEVLRTHADALRVRQLLILHKDTSNTWRVLDPANPNLPVATETTPDLPDYGWVLINLTRAPLPLGIATLRPVDPDFLATLPPVRVEQDPTSAKAWLRGIDTVPCAHRLDTEPHPSMARSIEGIVASRRLKLLEWSFLEDGVCIFREPAAVEPEVATPAPAPAPPAPAPAPAPPPAPVKAVEDGVVGDVAPSAVELDPAEVQIDAPEVPDGEALLDMTVAKIREQAILEGIALPSKGSKQQLIEALLAGRLPAGRSEG